ASTALWWQQSSQLRTLSGEIDGLRRQIAAGADAASAGSAVPSVADATPSNKMGTADGGGAALKAAAGAPTNGTGGASSSRALPTDGKPMVVQVPYGADALGGSRLDLMRQLFDRLVKESHSGVVDIKSYAGRFCLMGNVTDGYSLAPDETAF